MEIICKICSKSKNSYRKISKHIRDQHQISSRVYYDQYLKLPHEGSCIYCDSDTRFINISQGYKKCCSSLICRKKSAVEHRTNLKNDVDKFEKFIRVVSQNQRQIWDMRKITGEDVKIRKKIGNTISEQRSSLSKTEKKDKFGWQNKRSDEEMTQWKQEVMLKTGMYKWYKITSPKILQKMYNKRMATKLQISKQLVEDYRLRPEDKSKYYAAVDYITSISYNSYIDEIDPDGKRGQGFHLDHRYSKIMGFINNVDPLLIGSRSNLRIIPDVDNMSKGGKCDVMIEDLHNNE